MTLNLGNYGLTTDFQTEIYVANDKTSLKNLATILDDKPNRFTSPVIDQRER